MKRILFSLFSLLCLFLDAAELTILSTTDIHGNISAELSGKPGILRIASGIRKERENAGEKNVLLIDCGDLTQGTFTAAQDKGSLMTDALNALRYDVWVPGNHDFDYGTDSLIQRIRQFKGTVLAANLEFPPDTPVLPNVRKWQMFHRAGKKTAVIGCIPPYLHHWIAEPQIRGIKVRTPEQAVAEIMPEIRKEKPDLIVLAIHLGMFASRRLNPDGKIKSLSTLTSRFPQIRIVLGGHTHETVSCKKLYPESIFAQAPPLSEGFAVVKVKFGNDLAITGEIRSAAEMPEDTELKKLFAARISDDLKKQKTPAADYPETLEPSAGFRRKSLLSEILCKAMMEEVKSDAAFSTTLSNFRSRPGRLREREIFLLAPYENFITVLTLTPSQVREILKEQYSLKQKNVFLHYQGFTADVTKDGKVTALYRNGKPWTDEKETIRAAFGSYAVSGAGGRYPVLKRIGETAPRQDLADTVRNAFRTYLKKHYPAKPRRQ